MQQTTKLAPILASSQILFLKASKWGQGVSPFAVVNFQIPFLPCMLCFTCFSCRSESN